MSAVTVSSYSDECGMNDVAAELMLEICCILQVRDQLAMRRVCKLWRTNLSPMFLSRYVDLDTSKFPGPPENLDEIVSMEQYIQRFKVIESRWEHELNRHIQKNTRILVLRHVTVGGMFSVVARVIQEKQADLFQLILQDWDMEEEHAAAACWWLPPQCSSTTYCMLPGLISATRRLVLNHYTMRNVFGVAVSRWFDGTMPITQMTLYSGMTKKLPIVLPRLEFERSQPFPQHYRSFIMALDSNCQDVSPEVREDVVNLYYLWIQNDAIAEYQWRSLAVAVKCLNEGVAVTKDDVEVNVAALRQLDPRTLNKLTMKVLHRMYYPSWPEQWFEQRRLSGCLWLSAL